MIDMNIMSKNYTNVIQHTNDLLGKSPLVSLS